MPRNAKQALSIEQLGQKRRTTDTVEESLYPRYREKYGGLYELKGLF